MIYMSSTLARKHPEAVAGLLATAGLAWWWAAERMAGMDAGAGVLAAPGEVPGLVVPGSSGMHAMKAGVHMRVGAHSRGS